MLLKAFPFLFSLWNFQHWEPWHKRVYTDTQSAYRDLQDSAVRREAILKDAEVQGNSDNIAELWQEMRRHRNTHLHLGLQVSSFWSVLPPFLSFFTVSKSNFILINYSRHVPEWKVKKRTMGHTIQKATVNPKTCNGSDCSLTKCSAPYHGLPKPGEHLRGQGRKNGRAGAVECCLLDETRLLHAWAWTTCGYLPKTWIRTSQPELECTGERNSLLSLWVSISRTSHITIRHSHKITVMKLQQKQHSGWGSP